MKKTFFRLLTITVLLLLILAAIMLVKRRRAELAARPVAPVRPVAVIVKSVHRGQLAVTRHYLGTIEPEAEARLTSQTTGYLTALYKDVGDRLKKGEIVAKVDPRLAEARKKALAAELDGAQEDLTIKETIRDRRRRLIEKKAVSQEALDEAELAARMAKSRVQSLREELTGAQISLSFSRLESMFSGVVSERLLEVGDLVTTGSPVLRVENPERGYKIIVRVPQETATHLVPGSPARLSADNKSLVTVIDRIYPAIITGKLATVEIKSPTRPFNLPSYAELGVNLTVAEPEGWIIDTDCLLETGNNAVVFIVGSGPTVSPQPVTVLGRSGALAVVEGPLSATVTLAAGPESMLLTLGDGVKILPLPAKDAGTVDSSGKI